MTLDDGGDPRRVVANLRMLARQHGAVIIVNCLGALDLGGFRLVFGRNRYHGSDYVDIGMRARDGRLLR